jgi:hypothetical protein
MDEKGTNYIREQICSTCNKSSYDIEFHTLIQKGRKVYRTKCKTCRNLENKIKKRKNREDKIKLKNLCRLCNKNHGSHVICNKCKIRYAIIYEDNLNKHYKKCIECKKYFNIIKFIKKLNNGKINVFSKCNDCLQIEINEKDCNYIEEKFCADCNISSYSADYPVTISRGKKIYAHRCKLCRNNYKKTWIKKNKEILEEKYKYCKLCGENNTCGKNGKSICAKCQFKNTGYRYRFTQKGFINCIKCSCNFRFSENNIDNKYILKLIEQQNGKCKYTNLNFHIKGNSGIYQMSVDRINSKGTYTKDNCQLVCLSINFMKHKMSDNKFKILLKMIKNPNKFNKLIEQKYKNYLDINESFISKKLYNMKRRFDDKEYNVTLDDLINICKKYDYKCAITGIKFLFKIKNILTLSFDRIDSNKG